MRSLLLLVSMIFMLASCAKDVQLVESGSTKEPAKFEETAIVEVRLTDNDLGKYTDREKGIWEEARTRGLQRVFNKVLQNEMLFVPVDGLSIIASPKPYSQFGSLASEDTDAADHIQKFSTTVRFVGDTKIGGQIITLEESNFISGMTDTTYGMLFSATPGALPAYVAIAQPTPEIGAGFYRLIGLAEVRQVLDNVAQMPKEDGVITGRLCTLENMVSSREVEKDDMIFLLSVDVTALAPGASVEGEQLLETVVVQPAKNFKVTEPKIQK